MIKVGCCGFPVRRELYFKEFSLVEVQKTFYDIGNPRTYEKWRKEAPENFEFTLKAWQVITHPVTSPTYRRMKSKWGNPENYGFFKPTSEVRTAWDKTRQIAEILGASIVVFQTPPSFHQTPENLENIRNFFSFLSGENLRFALELRGRWEREVVHDVIEEFGLIKVIDPFKEKPLEGEINYFRLHGRGGYRYKYCKEELRVLRSRCKGRINYCLFNNTFMWEDSLEFKKMIE